MLKAKQCLMLDLEIPSGTDADEVAEPVETVTSHAVVTSAGEYPADVIILATGFDACVGAIKAIDIRGRDGRSIREECRRGWH